VSLKDLLMHFGISEDDADSLVERELPQYRAKVAYNESIKDLSRLESVEDFK